MIRVTVVGDGRVQIGLAQSARELRTPRPPLEDAGQAIARAAARYAAKRTGRLSRSNRVTVAGSVGRVTNRVKYAHFQEYGTRYMNAHPFLRPAARTDVTPYFERYAETVLRRNL